MANTLQNRARQGFASAEINWPTDTIKVVAVDVGYVYAAGHEDLADVGAAARIATATLANKSAVAGVLDADNPVFAAADVPAGDTITGFWIYKDTGVEGTSLLIYWIDTVNGAAVSIATAGVDIELGFSASGIVKI